MPFPLGTVLSAAPGVISAAADVIRAIRERKGGTKSEEDKLTELENLLERQAVIIEDLAQNNRNLALAVRNNRIVATIGAGLGITALAIAIWY
ncbi:MAG: hypothetical protein P8X48_00015 [Acidiferrobacteraceae bacterium]|jgi:hypothetical protein